MMTAEQYWRFALIVSAFALGHFLQVLSTMLWRRYKEHRARIKIKASEVHGNLIAAYERRMRGML